MKQKFLKPAVRWFVAMAAVFAIFALPNTVFAASRPTQPQLDAIRNTIVQNLPSTISAEDAGEAWSNAVPPVRTPESEGSLETALEALIATIISNPLINTGDYITASHVNVTVSTTNFSESTEGTRGLGPLDAWRGAPARPNGRPAARAGEVGRAEFTVMIEIPETSAQAGDDVETTPSITHVLTITPTPYVAAVGSDALEDAAVAIQRAFAPAATVSGQLLPPAAIVDGDAARNWNTAVAAAQSIINELGLSSNIIATVQAGTPGTGFTPAVDGTAGNVLGTPGGLDFEVSLLYQSLGVLLNWQDIVLQGESSANGTDLELFPLGGLVISAIPYRTDNEIALDDAEEAIVAALEGAEAVAANVTEALAFVTTTLAGVEGIADGITAIANATVNDFTPATAEANGLLVYTVTLTQGTVVRVLNLELTIVPVSEPEWDQDFWDDWFAYLAWQEYQAYRAYQDFLAWQAHQAWLDYLAWLEWLDYTGQPRP